MKQKNVRQKKIGVATLRLPAQLKDQVEALAGKERRSLSAMLMILVEEALDRRRPLTAINYLAPPLR